MSAKVKSTIAVIASLIACAATADNCSELRINDVASDGYTNHAVCGIDPTAVGTGEITLDENGYLELTGSTERNGNHGSRVRCENRHAAVLQLVMSSGSSWQTRLSSRSCHWTDNQLRCGAAAELVCLVETKQSVKQTLTIYAMIQVKEPVFDHDTDEIDQLRAWLVNQYDGVEFCRQSLNFTEPVSISFIITKEGTISQDPGSAQKKMDSQLFGSCLVRTLARHRYRRTLSTDYSLDWQIVAP